jgi:hypothetical protein
MHKIASTVVGWVTILSRGESDQWLPNSEASRPPVISGQFCCWLRII